jgi:inorganic pyrophosphatase
MHLIDEVPYKSPEGLYHMVVEIPAGTNEKWQTDAESGEFYHDTIAGKPRIINFLPYPMNYGYIPQTLLSKEQGGDGDPTDIISLAPMQPRGTISPVRVIGALKLSERGETDSKIVSLLPGGPFGDVDDISQLLMRYPGAVEIIRQWFEGYKGAGSFLFYGYADSAEAGAMIEAGHTDWQQARKSL